MEIGKYIGLGSSISVKRNKNETYTYFYSKKINGVTKRVKLFQKDKHTPKNFELAILQKNSSNINDKIQAKDIKTLNSLALLYFESRRVKKLSILGQDFNYLSEEEFAKSKIINKKMMNLKAEHQRYNKNVRDSDLADLDITKIKSAEIKAYTEEYLSKKGLSQKSTFIVISLIKTILNFAIRNEEIDILNPFRFTIFENPKRKRVRFLSINELKRLMKACKEYESSPNVYLTVYLAVITAARLRTVLNIKKKDIDVENQQIRLSNFKNSNKPYVIRLNDESTIWLEDKVLKHIDYNDYLIQPPARYRQTPQQPLSEAPARITKIMDELFNQHLDKKNNSDRDFVVNFHTIRRTVATNLSLQGANIYDIMILLNHSSTKQTQDYLNIDNQNLSKETDKFFASLFRFGFRPQIDF